MGFVVGYRRTLRIGGISHSAIVEGLAEAETQSRMAAFCATAPSGPTRPLLASERRAFGLEIFIELVWDAFLGALPLSQFDRAGQGRPI